MTFEFHADLARTADALERIAFLLEKLVFPPLAADVKVEQATLDDLRTVTSDDIERMREQKQRFAEIHQVVPGSEAFTLEIIAWEERQRSIHGEGWKAPEAEQWRAILAAAERRAGRSGEETRAAGQSADRS